MVEVVKLFLAAWTLKNIQIKLIHLLGGLSKDEVLKINHDSFNKGNIFGRYIIRRYFIELEKQIYGKSKQEWIDIVHNAIKNLEYEG